MSLTDRLEQCYSGAIYDVRTMPKSGIGGPVTLATGEGWATALVVDDRSLYFNTRRCVGGSCFLSRDNCSTMRVRKSGGMSEIFVRGGAGGLSLDSKAIFVGGVSRENSLLHVDKGTGAVGDMRDGSLPESIAVLGDMLELGSLGAELHRALAQPVLAHAVDLVFCCGPLMHALWEALPPERRGGYAETSAALESQVLAAVRPGDGVMVKGSLGSRMGPIVKALERRYSRTAFAAQGQE